MRSDCVLPLPPRAALHHVRNEHNDLRYIRDQQQHDDHDAHEFEAGLGNLHHRKLGQSAANIQNRSDRRCKKTDAKVTGHNNTEPDGI